MGVLTLYYPNFYRAVYFKMKLPDTINHYNHMEVKFLVMGDI